MDTESRLGQIRMMNTDSAARKESAERPNPLSCLLAFVISKSPTSAALALASISDLPSLIVIAEILGSVRGLAEHIDGVAHQQCASLRLVIG